MDWARPRAVIIASLASVSGVEVHIPAIFDRSELELKQTTPIADHGGGLGCISAVSG